jgi:hypothetical protein
MDDIDVWRSAYQLRMQDFEAAQVVSNLASARILMGCGGRDLDPHHRRNLRAVAAKSKGD